MKTVKLQTSVDVTGEDIDNICDAAFYGGISYWSGDLAVVKEPTEEGATVLSEYISRGGVLSITDEEGVTHELTLEKILNGIKLHGNLDFESFDASEADCVIQYAVFGELVYG